MTTAPDLPISAPPASGPLADPYPEPATYPALTLVPPARESADPADGPESLDLRDPADFDDALRRAMPRLRRYASRRLLDQHEAEEVVQEAFLRAFQHREQLATEDDLMAWLTVVTGRLTIDRLRVRGRMTPVAELPAGSRAGRDTAEVVVARDEARIALDALEAMPSRQASVLWAREVEGLSYDDICDRFALTEPTVRSLLHRARRTLRREYAERGGTLPTMGLVALAPWLRGLRHAGRVREIAKRGGSAAAIAATGLAITAVAPLWGQHSAPAHTAAPMHNYVAKAQESALVKAAPKPAAAAKHVAPGAVHRAAVTHTPSAWTGIAIKPHNCDGRVQVNCAAPHGNTLYVILPPGVKLPTGGNAVGVSTNEVPCGAVPDTVATHCEPAQRTTP